MINWITKKIDLARGKQLRKQFDMYMSMYKNQKYETYQWEILEHFAKLHNGIEEKKGIGILANIPDKAKIAASSSLRDGAITNIKKGKYYDIGTMFLSMWLESQTLRGEDAEYVYNETAKLLAEAQENEEEGLIVQQITEEFEKLGGTFLDIDNFNDIDLEEDHLEIAIKVHEQLAKKVKYNPSQGNGRTLNWNCYASVYASMRLAILRDEIEINGVVWNTIVRVIVNKMISEENASGNTLSFDELEREAYKELKIMDEFVTTTFEEMQPNEVEPIKKRIAEMFGWQKNKDALQILAELVDMNADYASDRILPELLDDLYI